MFNYNKAKLASLKLHQLKHNDREWVLNNLPDSFSNQVRAELDSIKYLNIENIQSILKQIDFENGQIDLDDKINQLREHLSDLSDIDVLLLAKSVDSSARKALTKDCEKLKRNSLVKKLMVIDSASCTQNFKNLFIERLLNSLEDK